MVAHATCTAPGSSEGPLSAARVCCSESNVISFDDIVQHKAAARAAALDVRRDLRAPCCGRVLWLRESDDESAPARRRRARRFRVVISDAQILSLSYPAPTPRYLRRPTTSPTYTTGPVHAHEIGTRPAKLRHHFSSHAALHASS